MPYAFDEHGVYALVNTVTGRCYVGQSRRLKKRIADHLNLLRGGRHPNPYLQNSFRKHGEAAFRVDVIAVCESPLDLNDVESPLLDGRATYDGMPVYNIAKEPSAVMTSRKHSDTTKKKISATKTGRTDHVTAEYRAALTKGQIERALSRPGYADRVREIVAKRDAGMTFTAIAKAMSSTPTEILRKYRRYKDKF